jgi:hypothetical protein
VKETGEKKQKIIIFGASIGIGIGDVLILGYYVPDRFAQYNSFLWQLLGLF